MRIARFESDGAVLLGRPLDARTAQRVDGDLFAGFIVSEDVVPIDRLLAPLVPRDILCIGVNYRAHAAETGSAVPQNPTLFIKASTSLNHPGAAVALPRNSGQVDYEAELAVVIGRAAKHVPVQRALEHVAYYTCANDVSARDWQKEKSLNGGQFARGKSFDGFCPLGPWLVTADEVPDPNALRIRCVVNGDVRQDASTADMIFDVPTVIASLSETMTLLPGTVILTGTPDGVAAGRSPAPWLRDGDRVSVEIDRIGRLDNHFVTDCG